MESWIETSVSGFQTTYEELKLRHLRHDGRRFRFQTTYEELKHLGLTQREIETLASRLPMRNWNWQRATFSSQSVCRLPDYLWGIETDWFHRHSVNLAASRLPMRNWNGGPPFMIFGAILLPDYLWGIETNKVSPRYSVPWELPDYLWGIETG